MVAPSVPLPGVTFDPERLAVIAAHEQSHFWHDPRRRLLVDTIESAGMKSAGPLLDVGSGTGALVVALLGLGYDARGIDPWARVSDSPDPSFRRGTLAHLPWPGRSFASVCAFDVLEHVAEAEGLAELSRVLRPGGRFFVSVPAHRFLWGPRDERAGHLRRYSRSSLRKALESAGYEIERIFGFQFLLLPALLASRLIARRGNCLDQIDREDVPSPWVNAILRRINLTEVAALRTRRPPTGSSLIAVARKPMFSLLPVGPPDFEPRTS